VRASAPEPDGVIRLRAVPPRRRTKGRNERGVEATVRALRADGVLDAATAAVIALARTGAIALDREVERLAGQPEAPGYTVAQLSRAHLAVLVELHRRVPVPAEYDALDELLAGMAMDD
jgi:hypothetical protein